MSRKLTRYEKRARKAGDLQLLVQQYGRNAGVDPNDRKYDRKLEKAVKRMPPMELDRLLRDEDEG